MVFPCFVCCMILQYDRRMKKRSDFFTQQHCFFQISFSTFSQNDVQTFMFGQYHIITETKPTTRRKEAII